MGLPAAVLLALLPLLWIRGFTVDDALISARVAAHLHAGLGYRFNNGGPPGDAVAPPGSSLAPVSRTDPPIRCQPHAVACESNRGWPWRARGVMTHLSNAPSLSVIISSPSALGAGGSLRTEVSAREPSSAWGVHGKDPLHGPAGRSARPGRGAWQARDHLLAPGPHARSAARGAAPRPPDRTHGLWPEAARHRCPDRGRRGPDPDHHAQCPGRRVPASGEFGGLSRSPVGGCRLLCDVRFGVDHLPASTAPAGSDAPPGPGGAAPARGERGTGAGWPAQGGGPQPGHVRTGCPAGRLGKAFAAGAGPFRGAGGPG